MDKSCTAARACFHFKPINGNFRTEAEYDILIGIIQETIQSEAGETAKFYLLTPDFELADGSFDLTVYRDEYVKKNPEEFGLKRKQVRHLAGPLPEEFASMMFNLMSHLAFLSEIKKETTYNLISVNEDGTEFIAAETATVLEPDDYEDEYGDDYDIPGAFDEFEDFGEIERYSIDGDDDDSDDDDL